MDRLVDWFETSHRFVVLTNTPRCLCPFCPGRCMATRRSQWARAVDCESKWTGHERSGDSGTKEEKRKETIEHRCGHNTTRARAFLFASNCYKHFFIVRRTRMKTGSREVALQSSKRGLQLCEAHCYTTSYNCEKRSTSPARLPRRTAGGKREVD